MSKYAGTQERVLSQVLDAGGSLKQLAAEDNGQWSATRTWGYLMIGIVADDVLRRGTPLSWLHVALLGIVAVMKVTQKWIEKPAQGTIHARALENMMAGVADKVLKQVGRGPGSGGQAGGSPGEVT